MVSLLLLFLKKKSDCISYVGLRADEEERQGIYGSLALQKFPLREMGWRLVDVWNYLDENNVDIPKRTDCAWCFHQRLVEWVSLLQDFPAIYEAGEKIEYDMGHTFRSASRDSFPAALKDLRKEFERGRRPRGFKTQLQLFPDVWIAENHRCRVCTL